MYRYIDELLTSPNREREVSVVALTVPDQEAEVWMVAQDDLCLGSTDGAVVPPVVCVWGGGGVRAW